MILVLIENKLRTNEIKIKVNQQIGKFKLQTLY